MLIKIFIFIVALYFGYRLVKALARKKLRSLFGAPRPEIKKENKLVPCTVCGTWVKEEESLKKGGKLYCSQACRQRGQG